MKPEPTAPHPSRGRASRRGVALAAVLLILAVIATLLAAIAWQIGASRRRAEQRQHQLQAAWLARAGVEVACAHLLTDPADYQGETVELIPRSQVRIKVQKENDDSFRITSEAHYPAGAHAVVVRSITRRVQRTADRDRVMIEVLTP
jgi:hypothetical protein